MKTKNKINPLLGAVLSLLVTFAITHRATAQTRIAFSAPVTDRKTHQTSSQVFSINSDGSGVAQLTRVEGAFPAWSPDQKYIAFHRATSLESTIYVMEAKGEIKGGRIFAVAPAEGSGHDWSRDGTMILFTGTSAVGGGLWLVSVNPASGAVGTPILLRAGACYAPKFSPDGTKIAYYGGGYVRVLDLNTGSEITIPGNSSIAPSWSPDGTKIAFGGVVCYGSTSNCHLEIVIANPDGTGWTPVTALQSYSGFPTWSPDGRELAFYSQVSGSKAIYKTTIGSGTVSLLYNGGQEGLDWAP
ncbi:MAG: PD40 domain-containing protein [Verrucomicrobia bacterium]|nr:PD40 domain-containing protein [Verrucomicrobiota bacterium]